MAFRDPFAELQGELEHMLERAFGAAPTTSVYPPVNLFDAGEEYVVKAEVPGIQPDRIEVDVDGDTLTIAGERDVPEPSRDVAHHRRERPQGRFRRVVRLPGRLAGDEAKADYRDGVLTVRVPKAKEARPRRVDIKAA
jgi:HSP20 family protein